MLFEPQVLAIIVGLTCFGAAVVWLGCFKRTRPRIMTCVGFYAFPFFLSANILFPVGTTVAERLGGLFGCHKVSNC